MLPSWEDSSVERRRKWSWKTPVRQRKMMVGVRCQPVPRWKGGLGLPTGRLLHLGVRPLRGHPLKRARVSPQIWESV